MRKLSYMLAVAVALLMCSFGAYAQSEQNPQNQAQSQEPQTQTTQAQTGKSHGKNVTVTGCLQKGTDPDTYTLTGNDGQTYELRSSASVQLEQHVGHTVTVTGSWTKESASESKKQGSQPEANPAGTQKNATSGKYLKVTDLKMVSETCNKTNP